MSGAPIHAAERRLALIVMASILIAGPVMFALTGHAQGNPQQWDVARPGVLKGAVTELSVDDTRAKRLRKVWVYTPPSYGTSTKPNQLLVLFDGADYLGDIPAPAILDNLHAAAAIPATVAVMVDNSDGRLTDLANHQAFADFVAMDLVPWARAHYRVAPDATTTIAGGYSAGGLAATYVAYRHPEVFGKVLSQSGAFWRGNEGTSSPVEWLTGQFSISPRLPLTLYIEVGANETHATAGGPVFIETNRRLRDVLREKGYDVRYVEVPGAVHNPAHWRTQLGPGLIYLASR